MKLADADLAYAAALIDSFAVLRVRTVGGTDLPEVTIQNNRISALDWLAEITGVRVTTIGKDFSQHRCGEHCPEKHTRVESTTRKWQITGARATVVLNGVERFMRVQGREARNLIEAGLVAGYKSNVVNEMSQLGWPIPDLKVQSRARVPLSIVDYA